MNLRGRDAIKPPKRYDEEMFIKPTPPPPACAEPRGYNLGVGRRAIPSPFVDFNPGLPPAAFPTIDNLQSPNPPKQEVPDSFSDMTGPMLEHAGANDVSRRNIAHGRNMASSYQEQGEGEGDGDGDLFMADAGYDIRSSNAPDELSHKAYEDDVNYLERWNSALGVRSSSMDLSDDENDVGAGAYKAAGMSASPLPKVEWSDISPVLQTEIFENLRSIYDYPKAVQVLKLNPREQVKMIAYSSERKEQIQHENAKLNEMRMKQLRALLRVDNSYLRTQKVPGQLVFRNISKKCLCDTTTLSGPDYSMSQASDILIARKYLRSIGLDTKFAGEWSNNLVTITTTGISDVDEDFEWTGELPTPEEADISENGDMECDSSPNSETAPDDSSQSGYSLTPKRARTLVPNPNAVILDHRRESSVSRIGTTRSLPFRGLRNSARSCQSVQSSTQFQDAILQPSQSTRESSLRLKVDPQRAARIEPGMFGVAENNISQPLTKVSSIDISRSNQLPLLGFFGKMSSLGGTETRPQHWSHQPRSSIKRHCETLERSLGGPWCYNKSREETETSSRASRALRNRLAAAKSEVNQTNSACYVSNTTSPSVNLTIPSPDNSYNISKSGLCECQSEGPSVESLTGCACSTAGYSGNPETIPYLGTNFVPHCRSPSSQAGTEGSGPQYSPITPPIIKAPCWGEENRTDTSGFEAYATYPEDNHSGIPPLDMASLPTPNDTEGPSDVTAASCSLSTTAERLSSTHVSAYATKNSVSPVSLEMTAVNVESLVMETDIGQDKHSAASTETAAPPTRSKDTVLFYPKAQRPDSSNAELSVPLGLERPEKPRKKRYRKSGKGWAKKRKPSSNHVEPLAETTERESTKNDTKSSVPSVQEADSRRRSQRLSRQAA
ncbi:hypothetical protein AJ78_03404 [Emergomyces pasteurianus Ep9510]|uniref:Uncharacterized protein n=1 Tax=Emergomyces pasteurianus Ep9510 TaxID=1447872 RepID=A0A1J9PIY7_9EURO|nr:hypothetical protein AJ78_03404 [Emergomyces pasteurianus Ep9510]